MDKLHIQIYQVEHQKASSENYVGAFFSLATAAADG